MSYSNGVEIWATGVVTIIGTKKGWKGSVWVANFNTFTEPSGDSPDWAIDTPTRLEGVTIVSMHDPRDYLKIKISGVTIVESHTSRPPEVLLQGITFSCYIPKPFFIIS
jgi:hypothetical protein